MPLSAGGGAVRSDRRTETTTAARLRFDMGTELSFAHHEVVRVDNQKHTERRLGHAMLTE